MADGYLKIKTKIDNSGVEKDISVLEDKIKKIQIESDQASKEQGILQEEIDKYNELQQEADRYKNKIKELNIQKEQMVKSNPNLAVQLDTPEFASLKKELAEIQSKYVQATAEIDKQAPKIEKVYSKLEKVKVKQTENNKKMAQFKSEIDRINVKKIQGSLDNVGKSIQNQIGKIGKMAMAVIGIRTAWNAVRSAVNLVKQYNSQISADFEYMGYCIANVLAPAIQWLTKLAYTLLSYINAIMTAWFGINLFSSSSAKHFQKMKNSAGGTAKSVKEIQKSLQGFDEMNVLQDNSNSDSGGSGGVSIPSMDLSGMQAEIPAWLQWIIKNKDLIIGTIAGITAGIIALKFGLGGIKSLGIGILVAGIVYTIESLLEYLKDSSWENFGKIIQGVGVSIIGLAILIGSVPLAIAGAIVLIIGTITKYWEQIKGFFQQGIDWLTGKSDWVHEMFGNTVGNIYDTIVGALQEVLNIFDSVFEMIKGIFDGFIQFIKGVFTGDWKSAWEGIKNIFKSIWEGIKNIFFAVWNVIKSVVVTVGKTVGNIISGVFKAVVNGVLRAIETILNSPIRAINGLIGVINAVPGINLGKINTFNLPRLAKGGVIAHPTTAVIGEAGREAVVPLENNMEWLDILADKLASRIGCNGGSYIIQLDGRTVQRGVAKRQQQISFAMNGR